MHAIVMLQNTQNIHNYSSTPSSARFPFFVSDKVAFEYFYFINIVNVHTFSYGMFMDVMKGGKGENSLYV